jgi:hypothetical protein
VKEREVKAIITIQDLVDFHSLPISFSTHSSQEEENKWNQTSTKIKWIFHANVVAPRKKRVNDSVEEKVVSEYILRRC